MDCLSALFPDQPNPILHVRDVLEAAHRAASTIYGTAAAQTWGGDYHFPPELLARDVEALQAVHNNLYTLAHNRRMASIAVSFPRDRVMESFGPDGTKVPGIDPIGFARLIRLAEYGVTIPLPNRFSPVSSVAPLRAKYIQVKSAVRKILAKQVE